MERKCADTAGTVPVGSLSRLAISNAIISIYVSNKIYGNNFIKQHTETVSVLNEQNADCSLKKINLLCHLLQFSAYFRTYYKD